MDRSNLRRRADLAYREYRAIMILTNQLTGTQRMQIDESLEQLPSLPRPRLQAAYLKIRSDLAELKRHLGAKAGLSDYEEVLSAPGAVPGRDIFYVQKFIIQRYFFDHYERAFPLFDSLPPHARIGIDTQGILRPTAIEVEWRLLEATLFEDMALLWNDAMDAKAQDSGKDSSVILNKWIDALTRATARAAFHLLEGYLNGMAYDISVTAKPGDLTDEDKSKLAEWLPEQERPRLLKLRDKLLQYPKIALHLEHPPLQENNCPEMAFLLQKEEALRHALVHPTPRLEEWRESDLRERVFFQLTVEQVGEVVDAVISLVRRLSQIVGDRFGKVDLWLYSRNAEGRFPKEAIL